MGLARRNTSREPEQYFRSCYGIYQEFALIDRFIYILISIFAGYPYVLSLVVGMCTVIVCGIRADISCTSNDFLMSASIIVSVLLPLTPFCHFSSSFLMKFPSSSSFFRTKRTFQ